MACGHASRYEAVTCVTVVRRVLRRRVGAWACACLPTRASVSGGDGCAASIVEWRVDASFWHQNVCRRRSRCGGLRWGVLVVVGGTSPQAIWNYFKITGELSIYSLNFRAGARRLGREA